MTDDTEPQPASLRVLGGDCLAVLRSLPDASVHAIVTDPPYGLSEVGAAKLTTALTAWVNGDRESVPDGRGFMGRTWDAFVPPPAVWDECLRVLRPGGHLVAFAGSRTYDLMGLSIRLAGFEIRDGLQWIYGSGMPKGLNVGRAITATERHGGASSVKLRRSLMREDYVPSGYLGNRDGAGYRNTGAHGRDVELTENGARWEGWGTALKPACEPMVLARKPLSGTVAATVLAHGTGAINIDGCRVESDGSHMVKGTVTKRTTVSGDDRTGKALGMYGAGSSFTPTNHEGGRWPANVLLDEHAAAELDAQSGITKDGVAVHRNRPGGTYQAPSAFGTYGNDARADIGYSGSGGASRFFPSFRYQAKAPARERPKVDGVTHPTVKPLALMRWLVRLVTPPGGTVLDPFAGSGTTLQAARDEGFDSIGIEREADYWPLIEARTGVAVEHVAPADPEPVAPQPEPVVPQPAAPEPAVPEPVAPVDTAELDDVVAKILAVTGNPALAHVGELITLGERALMAGTVAEALAVRDEVRAALLAARDQAAA